MASTAATGMGFIMTADYRPPVPADLEAGVGAALRLAERAATRSLLAAGTPAMVCAHLALFCVAFAGHHIAPALQQLPDTQETELLLLCPGCGSDTEVPGFFVGPVRPPVEAPGLPDPAHVRQGGHAWSEVAAALRDEALGEWWEPFLRVAREVAAAGVPPETPGQAVLCLVAVKGAPQRAGREWARPQTGEAVTLMTGGIAEYVSPDRTTPRRTGARSSRTTPHRRNRTPGSHSPFR